MEALYRVLGNCCGKANAYLGPYYWFSSMGIERNFHLYQDFETLPMGVGHTR